MSESASRLRQELFRTHAAMARTLRTLQARSPMVQGSFYLLRRKCGKPNCRCSQGELHPAWVLTRSEAGKAKLYSIPAAQRTILRQLAREYRRWQLGRARLAKQSAALLSLSDQLAELRLQRWPR